MAVGGGDGAFWEHGKQRFGSETLGFTKFLATFQKVRRAQAPKELTLSFLEDVSRRIIRRISRSGVPTRRQEVQGTAAD